MLFNFILFLGGFCFACLVMTDRVLDMASEKLAELKLNKQKNVG